MLRSITSRTDFFYVLDSLKHVLQPWERLLEVHVDHVKVPNDVGGVGVDHDGVVCGPPPRLDPPQP